MRFETERLLLTEWSPGDWTAFRPIATDPEVMRHITGGLAWPDERIRDFIGRQITKFEQAGYCRWKLTLKETGGLAGFCGGGSLHGLEWEEIGWWLARPLWGRGLATEAARAALDDLFVRVGLEQLVSVARPENQASIGVMRKLGLRFSKEHLHGGALCLVYTIERKEYLR
ncbi:MAG: GNAT family N-acetyltransferase [Acidobacteria bacterium]|nr:GNAT family N-acetyltransferase [Acidobacteriota bacterium]